MTKPFFFPTFEFLLPFFLNVVENSENAFPRSYGSSAPAFETDMNLHFLKWLFGGGLPPADAY